MDNKRTELQKALDKAQEGYDFSYIQAQAQGKELTEEQKAAKDRTKEMLDKLEDPKVDAEIQKILEN